MMKLYFSGGSCAMSCHIALEEAGLNYTPAQVDWDKPSAEYEEMKKLNPLGVVPVLVTDQGKIITQNAAILEFLADSKPSSHLLPSVGTVERAEVMQWVSFVSSDLHKSFGPLFMGDAITANAEGKKDVRAWAEKNLHGYLSYVEKSLTGKDFICGSQFTIADAYLFTVVNWCQWVKVPTTEYKNITSYMARVASRPAVQKAMKMEGLLEG
jgi:glutathione S-transferase